MYCLCLVAAANNDRFPDVGLLVQRRYSQIRRILSSQLRNKRYVPISVRTGQSESVYAAVAYPPSMDPSSRPPLPPDEQALAGMGLVGSGVGHGMFEDDDEL